MSFINNLKVHLSLIFFEKDLDMMFDNVLNGKKKTFLTSKTSFQHSGTMSIFAKGLTHNFHQIFESSSASHFL